MESVVGIFNSSAKANEAVNNIKGLGIPEDRIVLLTPNTDANAIENTIETTDAEPPGIGKALGGTVGGAIGAASGATLGAVAASLLVPGVGLVMAAGVLGAAVLGLGGAATGAVAGEALEERMDEGLPHDELFIYEDALRKGRSVVIAFPDDEDTADHIRGVFAQTGAETVDAAREDWWLGLRDAEEEHYQAKGRDFKTDEVSYRRGFETALHPKWRGKSYDEAAKDLAPTANRSGSADAFREGYERCRVYYNDLKKTKTTSASG